MISVVVPVYNVALYLRGCLDSLLSQTWADFEVLCVDDGSTDGSAVILDEYSDKDARLRVIHQKHMGVSAARNRAMDVAQGEWLAFVDADDQIVAEWFECAAGLMAAYPTADVVRIGPLVSVVDPSMDIKSMPTWLHIDEALKSCVGKAVRNVHLKLGADAQKCALQLYAREGWPVMNFVRRSIIGNMRFIPDVHLKEDVLFFMELATRVNGIVLAEYPGYLYTRRYGSAVMRRRKGLDSLSFAKQGVLLASRIGRQDLWRALTVALGYDFVQWTDEREDLTPYGSGYDAVRSIWLSLARSGHLYLGEMYFWWRVAIRHWLKTGDLSWAHRIRRIREWMGKFI